MSTLLTRLYLRRKGLLMAVAALPVFQATGTCDPFALNGFIAQQVVGTVFGLFVGSIQQVIFQNFPGSDVVQTFLGGNPYPIFP
jgi:hypothetical protein